MAKRRDLAAEVERFAGRLRVGEGQLVGRPLDLMPWQRDWLARTFKPGVRRSILSIARRNGKSATVSIIVLAALFGPLVVPNSMLISASRSREQASIIFRFAQKMIRASGLGGLVQFKESAREILCPRFGTHYRAISADAVTSLGFGARLVVHDELGQVRGPRDALYEALSSGMGSYADSLELIISTQAPSDADLLSLLIDDAAAGHDATSIATLYAAPDDCDLLDPEAWRAANPSLAYGVRDLADLERMAKEAKRLPSRETGFRNYMLNQRISTAAPFLTPSVWKLGDDEPDPDVFERGPVYAGLDLSARADLSALVLAAEGEDGTVHLRCTGWTPGDTLTERAARDRAPYDIWTSQGFLDAPPGQTIDFEAIALHLAEQCAALPIERIAFDRWRIAELQRWLERVDGYHVLPLLTEFGQGFRSMAPAIDAFEALALEGKLRHGGNPVLRWCVANCRVTTDPAGNRKFDKAQALGRIDYAVAALMAVGSLKSQERLPDIGSQISWI